MSDAGRQSVTDKVAAAAKPESEKGILEKASDFVAGKADNAAASATPDSEKSTTQKLTDSVTK